MSSALQPIDRVAIEDLLTQLCRTVDARDPEGLGRLLENDVAFDVGHGTINGSAQVVASFRERAGDTSYEARHTWSNLLVTGFDGRNATLLYVFATFAHIGKGDELKPIWRCGDCHDVVRRADDGTWRLLSRRLDIILP